MEILKSEGFFATPFRYARLGLNRGSGQVYGSNLKLFGEVGSL